MIGSKLEANRRFDMLLLEDRELYFEDYGAFNHVSSGRVEPISNRKVVKGRLHVCSKNLYFDPDDTRLSVMRLPYSSTTVIRPLRNEQLNNGFTLTTSRCVEMREGGFNHPYRFRQLSLDKDEAEFVFSLSYVSVQDFLKLVAELHELERDESKHRVDRSKLLQKIIGRFQTAKEFDKTWFSDLREKPLLEDGYALVASRITPLVCTPGSFMVTDQRIYFQPFNNISTQPVHKYNHSDIERIYVRRYLMKDVGLEIFFTESKMTKVEGKSSESVYFTFKTQTVRDVVHRLLIRQPTIKVKSESALANMTDQWRRRELSNYDYLMFLNQQAGRSFNDIAQYPVFPWVIGDYNSKVLDLNSPATFRNLSKPIGALNPERLKHFKERMAQMAGTKDSPPFLYGSHYSTPGYVLYYLVRYLPDYMLCLQNGRFDAPDRLFYSMKVAWQGVLTNPSDVKELIPEFYNPELSGEFLLNRKGLDLGMLSNGSEVDDVVLPPWASSAADFVRKCRAALESEFVSDNIHEWIDLIFGVKQRGKAAEEADNVFYYLTYEGAVDVEAIQNDDERASIEATIREFGQTPKQIFTAPHPKRVWLSRTISNDRTGSEQKPKVEVVRKSSRVELASALSVDDMASIEEELKKIEMEMSKEYKQSLAKPTNQPVLPISEPIRTDSNSSNNSNNNKGAENKEAQPAATSAWSRVRSFECSMSLAFHRSNITAACINAEGSLLFSAGQDGYFKAFSMDSNTMRRSTQLSDLTLSSCLLTPNEDSAIVGCWDNCIYIYSVDYGKSVSVLQAHDDAVSCLQLWSDRLFSSSWDASVKVWSLNNSSLGKRPLVEFVEHEAEIRSLAVSQDGNLALSAADDLKLISWDVRQKKSIRHMHIPSAPIPNIAFTKGDSNAVVALSDGSILLIDLSSGKMIQSFGTASRLSCMICNGDRIITGDNDGVVRLWDLNKKSEVCKANSKGGTAVNQLLSFDSASRICSTHSNTQSNIFVWKLK